MPTLSDFQLGTVPGLWRWYDQTPRQLAFAATTRDAAEAWQSELRAILARLLGGLPFQRCELDPHVLDSVEDDGYTRQLVVFQSQPGEYVPCYVLIPRQGPRPYRPVIALHGHGAGGARPVVGLAAAGAEAEHARRANYDYGRQLARRGFLVFAPVMRGFAERMEPPPLRDMLEELYPSSCEAAGYNALLRGQTLLGLRVWDQMRFIDYIETRPEHGGGDPRLLERLFGLPSQPDPLGHMAGSRAGAMAAIVGIAANRSMATGQPVAIADLLGAP